MDRLLTYLTGFDEEPGYLDVAAFGPLSAPVLAEWDAHRDLLARGRYGVLETLTQNVDRMRAAAASLTGFRDDQIVFQPGAVEGLTQAVFGVTGGILVSPGEHPGLAAAAVRASEALKATAPIWLDTDHGRVTPGQIKEQLTSTTTAVAVSLVDPRTGYLADLEGIRQVIGDRLLLVDATYGLGAVDAPVEQADVLACGGHTWLRAGYGCGFLAVSDRAGAKLTPVLSGPPGYAGGETVWDQVPDPADGAAGLQLGDPDPVAAARLAAAIEDLNGAGVPAVADRLRSVVTEMIALADEYAVPVVSPRSITERAGIVVLDPSEDQLTALTAALFNHGVSATVQAGRVRLSASAGTTSDTLELLRASLLAFATAARPVR